jgi:hypothetical protein
MSAEGRGKGDSAKSPVASGLQREGIVTNHGQKVADEIFFPPMRGKGA